MRVPLLLNDRQEYIREYFHVLGIQTEQKASCLIALCIFKYGILLRKEQI